MLGWFKAKQEQKQYDNAIKDLESLYTSLNTLKEKSNEIAASPLSKDEKKELKDIKLNYTDENFGNHITETNNTILKLVNDSHYTQLIDDILTDATSFNYSQSMGVNLRYTKIGLKYYNEQFDSNFKTFKKEKKNLEAMLGKKYKSSTIIAKKHKIEKVSERLLRDCESMSDKYGIISDTLRKFINENTIPTPIKKKENEKLREKLKKLDDKLTPQGNGTDEPPLQLSQLNDMVLNLRNKLIAQEHDQIRQELEDDNWEGAANDSRFLFDFLQKEDDKKRQRELLKAITENTATAEKNAKDRVTNAGVAEVNETDKKKNEQDKEQIKTEKQKFEDEKSNWQRIRR
jgi:hypothetical protein